MSPRLKSSLSIAASLLLAGGLLYLALRGADLTAVGTALAEGEWIWFVPFLLAALASVVVRAWRWGLLLDGLPEGRKEADLGALTASVFIGYLVNYAAPRLGEVARTANVARRGGLPFTAVLGTVVAERVLDVIALAATLFGVTVLYNDRLGAIWAEASEGMNRRLADVPVAWVLIATAAGLVLIGAGAWLASERGRMRDRLLGLVGTFRDGLLAVLRTGRAPALVASTVVLWACYALMADFPLRLLGITQANGLSHLDAWAVMAIGGIGMALPAPGGTGSFHYATVLALTALFAVAVTPAATYAILVHAAGIVFYAIFGGLALVGQGTSVGSLTREAGA